MALSYLKLHDHHSHHHHRQHYCHNHHWWPSLGVQPLGSRWCPRKHSYIRNPLQGKIDFQALNWNHGNFHPWKKYNYVGYRRGLLTDKKLPKKLHRCRTPFQNLLLYSPINIGRVPLSYLLLESHIIYATQRKGFGERGLNLSVSGAVAQDVPEMARQLVKMVMMVTMMTTGVYILTFISILVFIKNCHF